MKKKIFTLLFAVVAGIGTMFAESGTCGENLTWEFYDNGTLTISGTGAMYDYSAYLHTYAPWRGYRDVITNVVINSGATSIGNEAFYGCSGLTSIEIPNTVTSIGEYAFSGCRILTSLTIPNSVTSIKQCAFTECESLTSIEIPSGVTSIERYTFYGCSSLASVTIPNSVTYIGEAAFYGCSGLTSIEIPNSVTSIEREAFYTCTNLTSITIPNSVISIEEATCFGCTGLTSVTVGSSVTNIGYKAFQGCTSLTSIAIGNSVTSIGNSAFLGCTSLTSLPIPNSVTSIGYRAFYGCTGLTSVTIGKNITSIEREAFSDCSNLTSINVEATNPIYYSVDGVLLKHEDYADLITLVQYPQGKQDVTYIVPDGVTNIGEYAFENCINLTSITIPNSIIIVESNAFSGCFGLNNPVYNSHTFFYMPSNIFVDYTIPNGIEDIYSGAFQGCEGLTSVTFPNSVKTIGFCAFERCRSLTTVTIGKGITDIAGYAFNKCGLLAVNILATTPPQVHEATFGWSPETIAAYVPPFCKEIYKNAEGWNKLNIQTKPEELIISPTTCVISFEQSEMVASIGIEGGESVAGNVLEYNGLEPNSEYKDIPVILTSNTGETETIAVSFSTTALELTTQPSKPVSSTTAILMANTNMSDAEVSCGFEWKRNDAPVDMDGTKVFCPVANGQMVGRLTNLKDDVYYKYRAFYQSAAGNMFYGEWQYIFTGDNAVEFEPIIYTYEATGVTENEATLKGYAIAGAEDFAEQGFEYWAESRVPHTDNTPARMPAALGEHHTVTATGILMHVTLTDLDEGTVYKYRTYAKTGGQTVYGSEMSFTTKGEYTGTEAIELVDSSSLQGGDKGRLILHNGQIFILRGDKIYTVTGQEVK